MKRKNIIIIVLLLVICIYFGYKGFNLYYYNPNNLTNYEKFISGIKITNTITIKSEKLEDNQYLTFENIKVKNEFSEFKVIENASSEEVIKYGLHNENNEIKASFWIWRGNTDSYVNLLKGDYTHFGTEDKGIVNPNLSEILDKNNISNDIELFKYLEKSKDVKNNIFTSVKQMKENYTIQYLAYSMMPAGLKDITLIDGDYTGYILNFENDLKEVSILKDNKKYCFTFVKLDYFTDEYIQEILNTVVID